MEDYLEEKPIEADRLREDIRKATLDISIFPVMCGSSFKNKGVQPLLDAVVDYLPSPLDVPPMEGLEPAAEGLGDGERDARHPRRPTTTRPSRRSPSRSCPTPSWASSPTSASTPARSTPAGASSTPAPGAPSASAAS